MLPYSSLVPPQQTPILLHNPAQMSSLWNFLRSIPWPWAPIKKQVLNECCWMGKCIEWMKVSSWGQGWKGQEWGRWGTEVCEKLSQRGWITDEKGRKVAEKRGRSKGRFVVSLGKDDLPILTYFFPKKGNMVTTELKLPTEERHWEAFVERGRKIRSYGDTHCFCCYCCYR